MMQANLVLIVTCVTLLACTHAKIGYFWHITDFHYDSLYSSQDDKRKNCRRDERTESIGRYGDNACDSSLQLILSALRYMRTRHTENIEFVLWTGDIISSRYDTEDSKYQAIRNITELLRTTFSSHFVFPVLGHTDPRPSDALTNLWSHWLPMEALQTLNNGGYYTIEQTQSKLRIVALNTNLFTVQEENSAEALRQWDWLESVLEKATNSKEMVYLVGHASPGFDGRRAVLAPRSNELYVDLVKRHAAVVAGQFFGHLHADTFRIIYDEERPVSWALVSPALARAANPALRLYKFDTGSGKVLDYTQFYLDLSVANRAEAGAGAAAGAGAEWSIEYNFTQYYGLRDVSPEALHELAEKIRGAHDTGLWNKYLRAYNVRYESPDRAVRCDATCALEQYCAITRVERAAHGACVAAAARALATTRSRAPAPLTAPLAAPLVTVIPALIRATL